MDKEQRKQSSGNEVVLFLFRVVTAGILAGLAASVTCRLLLSLDARAFDFVCGHNLYFQWPFWFVLFVISLRWISPFKKRA